MQEKDERQGNESIIKVESEERVKWSKKMLICIGFYTYIIGSGIHL